MARYEEIITDPHSGEEALVKSNDEYTLREKIMRKQEMWDRRAKKEKAANYKESRADEAKRLTEQALQLHRSLEGMLAATLEVDDKINWDKLVSRKNYRDLVLTNPPQMTPFDFGVPKQSWLEMIWPLLKKKRILAENQRVSDLKAHEENYARIVAAHVKRANEQRAQWEKEKSAFHAAQDKSNDEILALKSNFESSQPEAIVRYVEMVMDNSRYPDCIDISCDVQYAVDRKTLLVDLDLPAPDDIPSKVEFKYSTSKDEITIKKLKKKDFEALYERIISQIAVRTIHEIFESVYTDSLDFVTLNGWVDGIDLKTGKKFRNCIVSVQAESQFFKGLVLDKIEPKQCLLGMKAQIASEFVHLAPVKPILQMNRYDKRIIESNEVIDSVDSDSNLAEMDWQKFEQLVRDLFEKEFSGDGVEVKVTQASRDAGVDAIVFDPDPIKGGKFVIQAKRYNNVVGVSAVRDLYGTMMNEGAVKGILVTTSNYGKDSIEFAKNKPLTLISGAELIYLFNKHGYQMNIATKKNPRRNVN